MSRERRGGAGYLHFDLRWALPQIVRQFLDSHSTKIFRQKSAVGDAEGLPCAGRFTFCFCPVGR